MCIELCVYTLGQRLEPVEVGLSDFNIHRLLLTSFLLATKYYDDLPFTNKYISKTGGISTNELNSLEIEFLSNISFTLSISEKDYREYHDAFSSFHAIQPENKKENERHPDKKTKTSRTHHYANFFKENANNQGGITDAELNSNGKRQIIASNSY
ncbi:MAG: Cyclin-dependent kinase [uncultured bacterium]|nr:MAG: Cyclin-dependent kinase [uncultured bacterium]